MELELERTFLLKHKPEGLEKCKSSEVLDIYFPHSLERPRLRLRKKGDFFEMTKKFMVTESDASEHEEHTISLEEGEFNALAKSGSYKVRKIRYYYDMPDGRKAEVDIYKDGLDGFCVVDFEFPTREDRDSFVIPDFCDKEITQDYGLGTDVLLGKNYDEMEKHFKKYNYKKIFI